MSERVHPLAKFSFCPVCGSKLWVVNNFKSKRCESCGFVYYGNPSAANVALILNEHDELLVVRRKKEPAKGTLDLPGGFTDMDETGEEGVIREVLEETGLHVTRADYLFSIPNLYRYSDMDIHTLDMFSVVASATPAPPPLWMMPKKPCGYPSTNFIPTSSVCVPSAKASSAF